MAPGLGPGSRRRVVAAVVRQPPPACGHRAAPYRLPLLYCPPACPSVAVPPATRPLSFPQVLKYFSFSLNLLPNFPASPFNLLI
jgi:hypothetical protein